MINRMILLTACACMGLAVLATAQEKPATENLVAISQILPMPEQLGEGWSSNRICALIDPLDTPSERADPGEKTPAAWLSLARDNVTKGHREAYSVTRYFYRDRRYLVYVQRWPSKDRMPNWGNDKNPKDPPGALPKVGEKVRFSQRNGLHNDIDFIRGRYTLAVESPGGHPKDWEPIKHLAEVLDANFLKAQAGIVTFIHENSPAVSAKWERLPEAEIAAINEKIRIGAQSNPPGVRSHLVAASWKLHFWGTRPQGSNYYGYVFLGVSKGESTLDQAGEPVIYDALLASKDRLFIVYGNNTITWCEERIPSATGGVMDVRRNGQCCCNYITSSPEPQIKDASLKAVSETNVLASLIDVEGMTNQAVWTKDVGWRRTTDHYRYPPVSKRNK